MKNPPKVSVVVPAYNIGTFIRESIDSALRQTITDLEVIVVDDGSTDDTSDRLADMHDPRLRVLRQENAGSGSARNKGMAQARAPYIAFLDGDDIWEDTKLEQHLAYMEAHPECDLSYSLSMLIDEAGADIQIQIQPPTQTISVESLLLQNQVGNGSAVLIRTEALGKAGNFNVRLPSIMDLDMWLRIALLRPGNICCIPEILTRYRRRAGQTTSDWRRMHAGWKMVFQQVQRSSPGSVQAVKRQALSNWHRYFSRVAYESGAYRDGAMLSRKSFCYAPLHWMCTRSSWLVAGACLTALILPRRAHLALDRLAKRCARRLAWRRFTNRVLAPD